MTPSGSSGVMNADVAIDRRTFTTAHPKHSSTWSIAHNLVVQIVVVLVAYYVAGKLGQATTNIRSGNLGPVWPASGIALAAVLAAGYRIWPGIAAGSFLVAYQSPVFAITAAGQAAGATLAAIVGAFLLRRRRTFDPSLSRLRDTLSFIVLGAMAGGSVSAVIGIASLYVTGFQAYSGLRSAWLIYLLGDATGVLIVTPLVFTLPRLFAISSRRRAVELAALLVGLIAACLLIFGDLPFFPVHLHVFAFAVLPFVMWAAIGFGIAGASVSVFIVAAIATLLTAFGYGPFSESTAFVNAVLLDVLFMVLALSGLTLGAVITERERAEADREQLIRARAAAETRLRLAAIVESSSDAILSTSLDGIILSWNTAAQRIFGFTEAEAVGQPVSIFIPPALRDEDEKMLQRIRAGLRLEPFETTRVTKTGEMVDVSLTMSPMRDAEDQIIGVARIARDITADKRAQEALSSVSGRLIEAQEQERTRIARELHDDVGQRLSLLSVNLTALVTPSSDPAREETLNLQKQASELAADVQALSHRLHSSRLELLGLEAAMRRFCQEFADQQKATVDFKSRDLPDSLPREISICLFRILQEALHNAAKHSGVREFEARLSTTAGQIELVVSDRGKGFDVAAARAGRGIGLVSMEERLKLVDGKLSIDSRPHLGTTIHARVPHRT